MQIKKDIKLADYSTMGLGGNAAYLIEISTKAELSEAIKFANQNDLEMLMLGYGSNTLWQDNGYSGLVLINRIKGYETSGEDDDSVTISVGAGEVWDSVVERSVEANLSGIEALSLIPGSAGATPVQNVGAYGQEIAETLITLEAWDSRIGKYIILTASDCGFTYRSSRFKQEDKHRFFITSITLRLNKSHALPPFYSALQKYLDEHNIKDYSPQNIRGAVVAIRSAKLPDPTIIRNLGSFFHNPIISNKQFYELSQHYSMIPNWTMDEDNIKVSAAWLIEQAGFKDYHDNLSGMATWPKQSLVFVNEHARSTNDLLSFRDKIASAIEAKFSIKLAQEPELLP